MISEKFETIFVHIPKTAGQSIETVFLSAQGLSWERRARLGLKANSDAARGPRRLAHLYAHEYVKCGHISQRDFDGYFKFSIVRDPYARALSEYRYRYAASGMTVDEFLDLPFSPDFSDAARHLVPQARYVMDAEGRLLVDQIIKFESLDSTLGETWRRVFGSDRPRVHWKSRFHPKAVLGRLRGVGAHLPHKNKSIPGPKRAADLTAAQRRIIEHRYAEDFRLFDYAHYVG